MSTNLSPRLHTHIASIRTGAPADAVEAAQRRLDARLAGSPPRQRPWLGWMAATATACMVLAITLLPTSRGIAFDVVQKHLRDFNTLAFVIEQRSQGEELPGIRVRMNRSGDVRTDIGTATSTIVSPRQHATLTLLHEVHQAMPMPLAASARPGADDRFAWLDAIRDFQGQATRLPGTRVIDGRVASGWSLETHGMHIALWADAEGLPLAVEINGGEILSQRMHVTLDAPIDPSVFSTRVPPGYHVMGPDEE